MNYPETSELPMLDIDKAIKASKDYMMEFEELKSEGLTNKQAERLLRFTHELVFISESEEE